MALNVLYLSTLAVARNSSKSGYLLFYFFSVGRSKTLHKVT